MLPAQHLPSDWLQARRDRPAKRERVLHSAQERGRDACRAYYSHLAVSLRLYRSTSSNSDQILINRIDMSYHITSIYQHEQLSRTKLECLYLLSMNTFRDTSPDIYRSRRWTAGAV